MSTARLEELARRHRNAYDPYEPYQGVAALFNADLHKKEPEWAPRKEWRILSMYEIEIIPEEELDDAS